MICVKSEFRRLCFDVQRGFRLKILLKKNIIRTKTNVTNLQMKTQISINILYTQCDAFPSCTCVVLCNKSMS